MKGATATIESSTDEIVYMVDLKARDQLGGTEGSNSARQASLRVTFRCRLRPM